jgi:hypothetical protein
MILQPSHWRGHWPRAEPGLLSGGETVFPPVADLSPTRRTLVDKTMWGASFVSSFVIEKKGSQRTQEYSRPPMIYDVGLNCSITTGID